MVNSQALKAGFDAKLFSLGRLGTCYYSLTVFGTVGQDGEGARGRGARPPRVPSGQERGGNRSSTHPRWKVVPRAPRDLPPGPVFFWFFRRARSVFDSILGPGMYFSSSQGRFTEFKIRLVLWQARYLARSNLGHQT